MMYKETQKNVLERINRRKKDGKKRFRNDKAKQSKAVVDFVWLHYGRYNTDTRHHKFSPNTYFGDGKIVFQSFFIRFFLLAA